jgi:hypothetical protein
MAGATTPAIDMTECFPQIDLAEVGVIGIRIKIPLRRWGILWRRDGRHRVKRQYWRAGVLVPVDPTAQKTSRSDTVATTRSCAVRRPLLDSLHESIRSSFGLAGLTICAAHHTAGRLLCCSIMAKDSAKMLPP